MSSITFPAGHAPSETSSNFYATPFDGAGFQMNPLSAHPPRSTRPSTNAENPQHYHPNGFSAREEHAEQVEELDEEGSTVTHAEEEEVEKVKPNKIRSEEIWRELFLTSNGRDKAFKLIQYSLRVYLLFHSAISFRRLQRPTWEDDFLKRLSSTASGLSFSRKTLLLFNWLAPLTAIVGQQSVPFSAEHAKASSKKTTRPFLHALLYAPPPLLLELVSAIADDVATTAKLGLLGKKTGDRAGRFADWCWLLSTIVGLVENTLERQINTGLQAEVGNRLYSESVSGVTEKSRSRGSRYDEKDLAKLRDKDYWLRMTRLKLIMDLIFVSYDIFHIKRWAGAVQAFTGLASAILSAAKLHDRQRNSLLKTVSLAA